MQASKRLTLNNVRGNMSLVKGNDMKNSTLNRSMLSGENMAVLAELKSQNEEEVVERKPINSSAMKSKQEELDFLWQNLKVNTKEEKSPGIYILAGFIAGALSMFIMTAMLSIVTFSSPDGSSFQERKIIKKEKGSFAPIEETSTTVKEKAKDLTPEEVVMSTPAVINDTYKVKPGDSLEAISVKFYGQTSPANTKKLQEANNLSSPHAIRAGQVLTIPLNM